MVRSSKHFCDGNATTPSFCCCCLRHETAPVSSTPKEKNLVLISARDCSRPLGHIAVGKIKSMNNLSDTNGNRTRGLPPCSTITLCYADRLFFLLSTVLSEPNGCTFKWVSRFILLHFIYSSDENSLGLSAQTAWPVSRCRLVSFHSQPTDFYGRQHTKAVLFQ